MQQGLLGAEMAQQQAPQDELQANPATFMTLQILKHFFEPETAQQWVQIAMQGNPAEVIAGMAMDAVAGSMDASGGKATDQDAQAALQEVITSLVLFLVSAGAIPQEAVEQVAQEAMQMAMSGGGQQQQPPPQGGGQPMPPQQPGGLLQ